MPSTATDITRAPIPEGYQDISERLGLGRRVSIALKRLDDHSFDLRVRYNESGRIFNTTICDNRRDSGIAGGHRDIDRSDENPYAPFLRAMSSEAGKVELLWLIRGGSDGDFDGGVTIDLSQFKDIGG